MNLEKIIIRIKSKQVIWLFLTAILAFYSLNLVSELNDKEPYPDYYGNLALSYIKCEPYNFAINADSLHTNPLKNWLNCFGYKVLKNERIIPILFSIALGYSVYLLGHFMTKNRFTGLVATTIFIFNPLVTLYDSSPTYDQAWAFFLVFSVVLLYKKPVFTSILLPLSIISKILSIAYLPVFLAHLLSEKTNHKKLTFIFALLPILLGIGAFLALNSTNSFTFNPDRTELGFYQLFIHIRSFLPTLLVFSGFLAFSLYKKTPISGLKITILWLIWGFAITPILYTFTEEMNFSYRYTPILAFMSIFVGMSLVSFYKTIETIKSQKPKDQKPK